MKIHLICLFLVLCACASQTQEQSQTHLRVMAEPWMFQKYPLREAKERFEKNHPGVIIELQKAPEGYPNRLLVAMMSHRSDTDLFFGTVENTVAIWAARDLLLPWDAYIQSHPNLQRDAFIPTFYDLNIFGGKQYALPVTAELFCFSINKNMAAQAGILDANGNIIPAKTWHDIFDYARRLTQRDANGHIKTVGLAANWTWPNSMLYATIKAETGTLRNSQDQELNLNRPEVRTLLTLTRQGAQEGITTLASMTDVNQPRSDLKARLVAMILTTHSRYLEAWETLGPNSTTIMPIPGKSGGVTGGTRSVVIPKNSRAIQLAQQFVQEELMAPYFSRFAWEKYGKLPCMRSVFETLKESEAHQLAQWAAASQPDPMFRDELPLTDAIKRHVQRYLTGQIELDPMLAQLQTDLKTLNLSDVRQHFQP